MSQDLNNKDKRENRPESTGLFEEEENLSEEVRRTYGHLLRETREVFARESFREPDAEESWEHFRKRREKPVRPIRKLWLWGIGIGTVAVAACMALMWVNKDMDQVMLPADNGDARMASVGGPEEVTVVGADGYSRVLGDSVSDGLLAERGIRVTSESVDYRHTQQVEQQILHVPGGRDFKITLSDGTEVWLNTETTLKYPSKFAGTERVVELVGEAYFKVAHDEKRPFIIQSPLLRTRVTGTEFNMRAYQDATPRVTLVEGAVQVSYPEDSAFVELASGENASLDSQGRLVVSQVDTYPYVQWKEGYFYFDNVPLADVIHELERWYNVLFEVKDASLLALKVHYTANRKEDLAHALENLNVLGQVVAKAEGNKVVLVRN